MRLAYIAPILLLTATACGVSEDMKAGAQGQELVRARAIAAVRQNSRDLARDSAAQAAVLNDSSTALPDSSRP